jgi:poly-gamma-glutamate synthesis protein (capsule biosynthesis protein)
VAAVALSLLAVVPLEAQNIASGQVFAEPPPPARDFSQDLAMKITAPFTVASVGDVMVKRPASMLQEPAFQSAFDIIRNADIGVGNMEGNLADIPSFEGPLRGMMGSREVAADLKSMGFDLMNRANNHVFDSDVQGLFSTIEQLDAAGIVHAGTGKNLEDARAPAYLDTPKGRVAIIGIHSVHSQNRSAATSQEGNIGGAPGLNALNTTIIHNVTAEQFEGIKALRRDLYTPPPGTTNATELRDPDPQDRVQLLGNWYQIGEPGTKNFEMNQADLDGILRSVRNAKTLADFVVVTIHSHQGPITAQQWLFEDQPADFLVEFAHQAIDNGADVFVGHGPHVLRGVEVYNGKPIFYGLGEFFYQWQHMDASMMAATWGDEPMPEDGSDVLERVSQNWRAVNFESMIALSEYDGGELVAVRLYPTHGAFNGPISQLGIPRTAPPEMAREILQRVARLSEAFGTRIEIENGVGVIRMSNQPAATDEAQSSR